RKGQYLIGDDEIELGHEYVAYPFDAMKGFVRWENDVVVEQRLGRIADRFNLERDELPKDQDWKEQRLLPLEDVGTGAFVAFVSGSFGGKMAINSLINTVARAVKTNRGDATPVIRLALAKFTSKQYGEIDRPSFEIVNEPKEMVVKKTEKTIKEEMSDEIP